MINSKKMRLTMFAASMVAAGALTGCFNDKSSAPAGATSFKGSSSLGALVGANCTVSDSTSPAKTTSYITDGDGEGTVNFGFEGVAQTPVVPAYPVFISCSGGEFFDEADPTGGNASNGFKPNSATLRSIIPDASSVPTSGKVAVTTLTSMAAAVYDRLPASKKTAANAAISAKQSIQNVVAAVYPGLLGPNGEIDAVLSAPAVVKNATPTLAGNAGKYAAVLAGLAQIAKDTNTTADALLTDLVSKVSTGQAIPTTVTQNIVSKTNTYAASKPGDGATTTSPTTQPAPPADGQVAEPTGDPATPPPTNTGGNSGGNSGGQTGG